MNYGVASVKKGSGTAPIRKLEDFIDFRGGNRELMVPVKTKRRKEQTPE